MTARPDKLRTDPPPAIVLTRRGVLLGVAAGVVQASASFAWAAAPTDRRFAVVMLRGGLDGMATVVPYGDRDLRSLRGALVPPNPGEPNGLLNLDGFFGLHPSLIGLHGLYGARDLLPLHAVAGPYRNRSHFDAQDFMEAGSDHRLPSGWLNRVAGLIPDRGKVGAALAVGTGVPPLLRGPVPVSNWSPPIWPSPAAEFYGRMMAMQRRDPVLHAAFTEGLKQRGFTEAVFAGSAPPPDRSAFAALADRAGRMLAADDGPRLVSLETEGWDTHTAQFGRLGYELHRLDAAMLALKDGLGAAWPKTVVLVITEFGRTARMNGTTGTDHGTGGMALLLGGAVAGGSVRSDWPGVGPGRLFEDRDLRPTLDTRSIAKGVLAQHLGLDEPALAAVFPDSRGAVPLTGLVRT
jgi:uncharacterized protein (DUF1501 family)